ncbi:MAG: class I SAM-dependent methyltransferase [Verrucomicrobia bacterium]|nr:class I SAM-dependent methyltransferase [Verrucomicrobiota bacterium]
MNDSAWLAFCESVLEVQRSNFMKEMEERLRVFGSKSSMGMFDSAVLLALVRKFAPSVCVETGGNLGMSSSFILQGMYEAGIQGGKLLSVEVDPKIPVGSMIPERLRSGFNPLFGDVKHLMKKEVFPEQIDLFLHDSSHRYKYQSLEFRYFWTKLRSSGVLVSHDVNFNASFVDFVSSTYRHDKIGVTDWARTTHRVWGRLGTIGFIVKA